MGLNMPQPDFYAELGVAKGASDADIKRAYRNLARKYHPDVNDDAEAEARFKRIGQAYAVLSDSAKRARYDRYGMDGLRDGFDPKVYERMSAGYAASGGGRVNFEDLFGGFSDFAGFSGFSGTAAIQLVGSGPSPVPEG